MKKLLVILWLISAEIVFGQTSGWEYRYIYKEQMLKINKLNAVHFNEDGSKFYTLHANKIVYYWDSKSGTLLDSLIIPEDYTTAVFSKDGRTLCYYLPITSTMGVYFSVNVFIYDLFTKKRIAKSIFNGPKDINYIKPYTNLGYIDYPRVLSILDFDYNSYVLKAGVYFTYYWREGPIQADYEHRYSCGGLAFFAINKDSVYKIGQATTAHTLDYLKTGDSDYMTLQSSSRDYGGSSSLRNDVTESNMVFSKIDTLTGKYKQLKAFNQKIVYSWVQGSNPVNYTSGTNRPFSKIYYDSTNSLVYVKALDIYYVFDTKTDSLVDSVKLEGSIGLERITKDFSHIIYYYNKKIIVLNLKTKVMYDWMSCPMVPVSLDLTPNNNDIIVANDSGKIFYYYTILSDVKDRINVEEMSISPNPASDFIEISVGANGSSPLQSDVRIYDVLGEIQTTPSLRDTPPWKGGAKARIDVSSLAPGMYFVRIGDRVQKFVKI